MSIKITSPNTSSDTLTFGSANTPTAAQIAGIDSGSSNGQLALYTTASGTSTERVRVDSSGNVGIGVVPSAWGSSFLALQAGSGSALWFQKNTPASFLSTNTYYDGTNFKYLTTAQATYYQQANGAHLWLNAASGTAGNTATFTQAMTLDASGNLRLGTTGSSDARLYARGAGTTSATASFEAANSSGVTRLFVQDDGTTRFFGSAGSETARIDSSGNLLVGTTSAGGAGLTISTGKYIWSVGTYNNTTGNAANMFVGADGSFNRSTSSIKYKTNVQDANHGLAEVLHLRSVIYKGKNDGEKIFGGLIAEEVHEAGLTEFVQYAEDGSPDALAYGNMVSLCIKAIQEQQALITTLTDRITALEGVK